MEEYLLCDFIGFNVYLVRDSVWSCAFIAFEYIYALVEFFQGDGGGGLVFVCSDVLFYLLYFSVYMVCPFLVAIFSFSCLVEFLVVVGYVLLGLDGVCDWGTFLIFNLCFVFYIVFQYLTSCSPEHV